MLCGYTMDTSQSNYISLLDINIIHKAYQTDPFSQGRSAIIYYLIVIIIMPIDPGTGEVVAEDIF